MISKSELDAAFNESTRYEDLRLLAHQAAGLPVPEAQPGTPATSGFKFEREVRFHPESGKRTLVIRANTQADLDALEAQILGY